MMDKQPLTEREASTPLRLRPWEYGYLGRRKFAHDHEGFFRMAMQGMTARNVSILEERLLKDRTLSEIARHHGLSRSRVEGIECTAFSCVFRAIQALWEGR